MVVEEFLHRLRHLQVGRQRIHLAGMSKINEGMALKMGNKNGVCQRTPLTIVSVLTDTGSLFNTGI